LEKFYKREVLFVKHETEKFLRGQTIYLALGSNMGDRKRNIDLALRKLEGIGVKIEKISSLIETDPAGGPPQGKYLNAVLRATTELSPEKLLIKTKVIEQKLGRTPTVRNGPRPIDIDILLYDDIAFSTPELTIPHPRMRERDFVMNPLSEIAPGVARALLCGS
jgi:2-amino-4-hydroxy-6-hydroxymethyldihydropteridine diphosphokinase